MIVKCELFWIFIEVFQSWRSVVYLFNTGLGSIGASVGRYVMGSLGMIFVIGVLWCCRIYLLLSKIMSAISSLEMHDSLGRGRW